MQITSEIQNNFRNKKEKYPKDKIKELETSTKYEPLSNAPKNFYRFRKVPYFSIAAVEER
jgi:hypothetical protein